MEEKVEYDTLEDSLKRCGSSWDGAQTHGLLTGRLAIAGVPAGPDWLMQILEGVDESNASREECEKHLDTLYQSTFWQLSERLSEFELLLPSDDDYVGVRTGALAHWSEGFLHGLVSSWLSTKPFIAGGMPSEETEPFRNGISYCRNCIYSGNEKN